MTTTVPSPQSSAPASAPVAARRMQVSTVALTILRPIAALILALLLFGIVLLLFGKDPIQAYIDIYKNTLGSRYGFSEVLVKTIPLLLCALAVLVPARLGLVNVGGEGQL
ncbi:MAG: hypothetical protein KDE19_14895, partial [Caldilineaceae bacterium]|nr:hypothetical protein [Caldilineaceae bacterium]